MAERDQAPPAFLLGAGASREGGLPLSTEITDRMLSELGQGRFTTTSAALNFVVGAIIAHDSRSGGRPDQRPDIERVASAVELLAERSSLEVTPFVTNWDPAVEGFERRGTPRNPAFVESDMKRALGIDRVGWGRRGDPPAPNPRDLIKVVESIVDARSADRHSQVFGRLLLEMVAKLGSILHSDDKAAFDYLAPILNFATASHPLKVCTLNYDLGFEAMAARAGREFSRGVEGWSETGSLDFSDADIHLVKLHGSLDWARGPGTTEAKLARGSLVLGADQKPPADPFLVFGQREKLRAPGPFLQLLSKFRQILAQSRDLVVIGYAFRDDHINEEVARWLDSTGKRLVVVDPGFPEPTHYAVDRGDFRQLLMRTLHPTRKPVRAEPPENVIPGLSELAIVRQGTSEFLQSISTAHPHQAIDNLFER